MGPRSDRKAHDVTRHDWNPQDEIRQWKGMNYVTVRAHGELGAVGRGEEEAQALKSSRSKPLWL